MASSKHKTAYLSFKIGSHNFLDSVEIVDGRFKFSGKVKEPTLATLRIKGDSNSKTESFLFI